MKTAPLEVEIVDDKIIISIGISSLATAILAGPYFDALDGDVEHDNKSTITDEMEFANEIRLALSEEDEEGATIVHKLFDRAAKLAIESGAEGIELSCDR